MILISDPLILGLGCDCSEMIIATDGTVDTEGSVPYNNVQTVTLPSGDGAKTVEMAFLDNALKNLDNGNNSAACGQLDATENEINAMINGGKLTGGQGNDLLGAVDIASSQICS